MKIVQFSADVPLTFNLKRASGLPSQPVGVYLNTSGVAYTQGITLNSGILEFSINGGGTYASSISLGNGSLEIGRAHV